MLKITSLVILLMTLTSIANAGGYRVSLQGQKAQGMGHASTGLANSVETLFFNPAGLTTIDQNSLSFGINAVSAENNYQNLDLGVRASTDSPIGTPINLYWAKPLNDKSAVGVGIYTPYGSKVEWPTDWAGSHLVNSIDLQVISIQPTYAYQLNDTVSLGAGLVIALGSIDFNRNLTDSLTNANGDRANVTLSDSGITEFGVNLGALFVLNNKTKIGINYRNEITMESDGDAVFRNVPGPLSTTFVNGGYNAELPLPAELTLGLSYQYSDRLTLVADYNYTYWDAYEALDIDFSNAATPDSNNPRNYKNNSIYRFGFEYLYSDKFTLRAGFYYDESPIRDGFFAPETPRGDQSGITGGLTYKLKDNVDLDFSAIILDFKQINSSYDFAADGPFEGSYTTTTWILGAGAAIQF